MIELIGVNKGKEYEAALHIRSLILSVWPDIAQSDDDVIKICVGLKLYGRPIEDIDIAVIGSLSRPRDFAVEYKFFPREGDPFVPRSATVKNFALVIETKSHDARGVKFEDKVASVRYNRCGKTVWECVTEKNRQQMFEFKAYLSEKGAPNFYVQDLIYFSGLREADLPARPHNCFGCDSSFERILNILGQISGPTRYNRQGQLNFGSDDAFSNLIDPNFTLLPTMEPTAIDRRRMDRIAKAALSENWLDNLGKKQLVLRGRGGVGKTVILLQLAYRIFDRDRQRSLLLTYNKALVSDMCRTMALLGVPRSVERGGISIETVHSFIGRLLKGLGIIEDYEGFLQNYETHKDTLVEYIRSGAVSREDIDRLIADDPDTFAWDVVFVDEGQDWPSNEISILRSIYASERLAVADGVDQYVRSSVADWSSGVDRTTVQVRRLRRCLRMKENLAYFVADFAKEMGLDEWDLEPNSDANGGQVIIYEGDLAAHSEVYDSLKEQAAALGNYPIDLLACVPPSLVMKRDSDVCSSPGAGIVASGGRVWDATSKIVREQYPTDRDALRIVQYDSCRGLEGWTVINYAFDAFWQYKFEQWLSSPHEIPELFQSEEELADAFASQWAMIPLTRAMDTLVINISKEASKIKSVLAKVQKQRTDFVDWIEL